MYNSSYSGLQMSITQTCISKYEQHYWPSPLADPMGWASAPRTYAEIFCFAEKQTLGQIGQPHRLGKWTFHIILSTDNKTRGHWWEHYSLDRANELLSLTHDCLCRASNCCSPLMPCVLQLLFYRATQSWESYFCPFVTCVLCDKTKQCTADISIPQKGQSVKFSDNGGQCPLPSEICIQSDPPFEKRSTSTSQYSSTAPVITACIVQSLCHSCATCTSSIQHQWSPSIHWHLTNQIKSSLLLLLYHYQITRQLP